LYFHVYFCPFHCYVTYFISRDLDVTLGAKDRKFQNLINVKFIRTFSCGRIGCTFETMGLGLLLQIL